MRSLVIAVFLCATGAHALMPPTAPVEPPRPAPIANPGWLGLRLEPATDEQQKALGVTRPVPRVGRVFGGSPALAAGVLAGDFVLSYQGQDIADVQDLVTKVGTTAAGTAVTVTIQRGSEKREVTASLAARPDPQQLLQGEWLGKPLPTVDLALASGDGRFELSAEALKGKVVMIDYFATWCGPCKKLAIDVHALLEKEHGNGLEVISISTEELDVVKAWVAKAPPKYTVAVDDKKTFEEAFQPSVMPTVWIIDREGRIRGVWAGANEYPAMEKLTLQLLGSRGTSPKIP